MKKMFLLVTVFLFLGLIPYIQADDKGKESFFTSSELEIPVGVIIYQDLEIDLGVKKKKRWTHQPKKWAKYYTRGDEFLGFVIPEKDKNMNIHVLISKDVSDIVLEKSEILKLGKREFFLWCERAMEKKAITEDNFCFEEIIPVCVNGEERTPAFFLESSVHFPNGNVYEMSFLLTVYEKRKVFFVFKNFNKVKKSSYSFKEDLTKDFLEKISLRNVRKLAIR